MIIPFEEQTLKLDLDEQCLRQGQQEILLTPKSFALLRYLVEHRDTLLSKQELFDKRLARCLRGRRSSQVSNSRASRSVRR